MPMPETLRKSVDLLADVAVESLLLSPDAVAPAPMVVAAPVDIFAQERDFWCWAAVVQTLLAKSGSGPPPQCSIAERHLTAAGKLSAGVACCPDPSNTASDPCNQTAELHAALQHNGFHPGVIRLCNTVGWPTLEAALKKGPVPCRLSGGFNHYCLLGPRTHPLAHGTGLFVEFFDPWCAESSDFEVDSLCFVPEEGGYVTMITDRIYFPYHP